MQRALLLLLIAPGAAVASDPFACVDPDVASAFLGHWHQGEAEYSTEFPTDFVPLDVPEEFSLLGSQRTEKSTTVAFRANMDADSAFEASTDKLAGLGWTASPNLPGSTRSGFQHGPTPSSTVVCKDDEAGGLSVIAYERAGKAFVNYIRYAESNMCEEQPGRHRVFDTREAMDQLPALTLPGGVKATNIGRGGDGDEVVAHVDVTGSTGRADLHAFLERQLRNQQWDYQTNWSSPRSSGSVWRRSTNKQGILIGTLHVFDSGSDPIRIRFSVSPADPAHGVDRGRWSSSSQ